MPHAPRDIAPSSPVLFFSQEIFAIDKFNPLRAREMGVVRLFFVGIPLISGSASNRGVREFSEWVGIWNPCAQLFAVLFKSGIGLNSPL